MVSFSHFGTGRSVYQELRRFGRQSPELTSTGTLNPLSSRTTPPNSDGSVSKHCNTRGRINSLPSNSRNDTTAINDQPDMSTELEEKKQQLVAANQIFKNLARSYLKKRAPPDPESMRELWEYKDILDLKTVFTWRDEAGIRRGVLYEDGKIEFEEWPLPPHENIIDVFETIFKKQFVFPWPDDLNPTFEGTHSQGKDPRFL
jgi:hypothetical protein